MAIFTKLRAPFFTALLLGACVLPSDVFAKERAKAQAHEQSAKIEHSLQSTLKLAFSYNPSLKVAQEALLAAMEDLNRAQAGYFPVLGAYAGAGFSQSDNSSTRYKDEQYRAYGTTNASMRLRQPIWEGGTTQAQVKTRTALTQAANALVDDAGATLALSALVSHVDVKRRALLLAFARENVREHESIYAAVQERYGQGIATTGEVNQIAARVHRALSMRSLYQANLDAAKANYLRVTGVQPPASLEKVELPLKLFPTPKEACEMAQSANPRIQSGLANIRAMLGEKDFARTGLNPKVTVDAGPSLQNQAKSNAHSFDWQAMLNLSWEFNTGGADQANIRASSARVRQAKQELHVYMDTLREDIESSFSRMLSARQQSNEMEKAKKAAKIAREDFYQQFLAGQRGLLDVLDAASEYFSYASEEELNRTDSIILAYRLLALSGQLMAEFRIDPEKLRSQKATAPDTDTAFDAAAWSTLYRKLDK